MRKRKPLSDANGKVREITACGRESRTQPDAPATRHTGAALFPHLEGLTHFLRELEFNDPDDPA